MGNRPKRDYTLPRRLWEEGFHPDAIAAAWSRRTGEPMDAKSVITLAAYHKWQRPASYNPKLADKAPPSEDEVEEILARPSSIVPATTVVARTSAPEPASLAAAPDGSSEAEIELAAVGLARWIRHRMRGGDPSVAEVRALAAALKDVASAIRAKSDSQEAQQGRRQQVVQIAIVQPRDGGKSDG